MSAIEGGANENPIRRKKAKKGKASKMAKRMQNKMTARMQQMMKQRRGKKGSMPTTVMV